MATQEQELQVTRASVDLGKPNDWAMHSREKTSPKAPDNKAWTLAESPEFAMNEEYPEHAEIIRRLQVLAEERS